MVWPPEDIELHDLGPGHAVPKVVDHDSGEWVGIWEWHKCSGRAGESTLSPGGVNFENAPAKYSGARWKLVREEPLTITPSILCHTCGLHGFITDGRWVPA